MKIYYDFIILKVLVERNLLSEFILKFKIPKEEEWSKFLKIIKDLKNKKEKEL